MPDFVNTTNQFQGFGIQSPLYAPFFNNISFPVSSSILGVLTGYGTTPTYGAALTNSLRVADYNNHAFSISVTGSGVASSGSGTGTSSVSIASSVDGVNWFTDFTFGASSISSSGIVRLTGRRTWFAAYISQTGSLTSSVYVLSGQ